MTTELHDKLLLAKRTSGHNSRLLVAWLTALWRALITA